MISKDTITSLSKSFEDSYDKLNALLVYSVSDHKNLEAIIELLDITIFWARLLASANTYNEERKEKNENIERTNIDLEDENER